MALRSIQDKSVGRSWGLGFLRPRWGVRGSLFAAFAVIAGMVIVISAGAGIVLRHLGGTMVDLSGRDIPRLAASLQLAAQSASLAGQGPALLASQSQDILNERSKKIKETQDVTLQKLGEIIELGADKAVVANLTETIKNIDDTVKSLVAAARERLEVSAQHEKQYDALRNAQANFVAAARHSMMNARTQLSATLGAANLAADDATEITRKVDQIGNVIADGNLIAFDMMAALSANKADALEAIQKDFQVTKERVSSNLDQLPTDPVNVTVSTTAQKLLALGEGKTGVFKTRQKELDANDYGQVVLEEAGKLNIGLGISVQQLVNGVQTETDASTWHARQEISFATATMLVFGALTFVASALFVWLYVGGNILRRIGNLQRSMQLLSNGDLEIGDLSQQPAG